MQVNVYIVYLKCLWCIPNSHYLNVAAGVVPCDALRVSPILHMGDAYGSGVSGTADAGNAGAGGGNNTFEEYGGIDPTLDPELAMAIRVSMEESRVRYSWVLV